MFTSSKCSGQYHGAGRQQNAGTMVAGERVSSPCQNPFTCAWTQLLKANSLPLTGSPFPAELLGGGLAVLPQWLSLHLTSSSRGTVGSQHRWTTSWE